MPRPMTKTKALHRVPTDLKALLDANPEIEKCWVGLTSLARNEWICWVTMVKKQETREEHLKRLAEELLDGKRRPCCWPGCPHRRPKAAKWFGRK